MSLLAQRFAELQRAGRTALVSYITAGDPDKAATVPLMHALVEAGTDVVELGVPFSDPTADGQVIQQACERALKHGTTLADVLGMVREFRQSDTRTPVVLMGYLNPVEAYGVERFALAGAEAGVDGVLMVDMPPEEAEPLAGLLRACGLDPVFLLAPTTEIPRIKRICESAAGFVYYVSLKGVTGATSLNVAEVRNRLEIVRCATHLPVGVGFGVRDAQTVAQLAEMADAVVVGSAIVERVAEFQERRGDMLTQVGTFVSELRQAMDAARA